MRFMTICAAAAMGIAAAPALAQQPPAGAPPGVVVEKVEMQNIKPSTDFTGRVKAVGKVDLRTGDLMFVIEKAPYQAEVDQQRAAVAKAQASVTNATQQLARARDLIKNQNIAQSTVDTRQSEESQSRADLLSAQAALRSAEINLGYTDIKAPIDGRIGQANITIGNLVSPDSGVLATIVSQDPIYVTFQVAQRVMTEVRAQAAASGQQPNYGVRIRLPDGTMYKHPGKIDSLDVQVAQGTDTLTVRAELPNPDRILVDGQSVGVVAEQNKPELAVLIPYSAIQVDQAGRFVLVVDKDNKVEVRRIKATPRRDGTAVVEDGLKQGEQIIVDGILKVRPGMVVAPTVQPSSAIPKS